jgi:dGTPase
VDFSDEIKLSEKEIRLFLRTKMYNNKDVLKKNNKGKKIINQLFKMIIKRPLKFIDKQDLKHDKFRAVSDFISGMTDRYAINLYKSSK